MLEQSLTLEREPPTLASMVRLSPVVIALCLGCGEPPPSTAECSAPDLCADRLAPGCSACPATVGTVCVAGRCEAITEQRGRVGADVHLNFRLTGQIQSMIYGMVDRRPVAAGPGDLDCTEISVDEAMADQATNLVHSGLVNFQNTAGTALFPDANLGYAPAGSYLLLASGRTGSAGAGDRLVDDCLAVEVLVDTVNEVEIHFDP